MAKMIVREKAKNVVGNDEKLSQITSELKPVEVLHQRKIGLSKGVTINMGNYEAYKIAIWQERYCEDTEEASNKTIAEMMEELDALLEAEVDSVKGGK